MNLLKQFIAKINQRIIQSPNKTIYIDPKELPQVTYRDKIGKYELISEIARGAMGVVLLGNDPYIKRKVAIKIINPTKIDRGEVQKSIKLAFLLRRKLLETFITQI